MGAGFQTAIKGGIGQEGWILDRTDGIYFGMGTSEFVMIALPDNLILMNDQAAYQGIGPGHAQALPGQLKATPHV